MPPTHADFEAFEQHLLNLRPVGWEGYHNAVVQRFPNPADQEALASWASAKITESTVRSLTPVDRNNVINKVDSMDYRNDDAQTELVDWLERDAKPWIPIGKDQTRHYRLVPGAYCLIAHNDDYNTPHEMLCDNVLGVNTNVIPGKSAPDRDQQRDLLALSTASNGTHNSESGFVFHQLGTLERFAGDRNQTTSMAKLGRGTWMSTGFCVVVRFGSTGQSQGIYIIYDMFPENAEGDRVQIESGNDWGRLVPDAPPQFSCAKIGTTLRELQPGSTGFKTLTLTEMIHHPVEIVRAVMSPNGSIVGVTAAGKVR
jgi:hypothetical protein